MGAADAAADARLGRGSAGSASTTARSSPRRSGRRSSAGATAQQIRAMLADPERRTNKSARRYLLRALAALRPLRRASWSRGPAAMASAATCCAKGRGSAAAARRTSTPTRSSSSSSRPCLHRLDSPRARRRRRPRATPTTRRRSAGSTRPTSPGAAGRARRRLGQAGDHDGRVASGPQADRAAPDRRPQAARRRLTRTTASTASSVTRARCASDWDSLDLTRQHAIVAAVLDHVEVGPARRGYNRFDESRLRPVWRL